MKKILILFLSLIFVLSLAFMGIGCKAEPTTETTAAAAETTAAAAETTAAAAETTAAAEGKQLSFVLDAPVGPNPFINHMIYGMDMAGKELGVKVQWVAPTEQDTQLQITQLMSVIAAKPDGIAILMQEPEPFQDAVKAMNDQGTAWGCFNTGPMGSGPQQLFFIGANDTLGGKMIANRALADTGNKIVKYLMPNIAPGHQAVKARYDGIRSVLDPLGIKGTEIDATIDTTECYNRVKAFLIANPDTDVIFAVGSVHVSGEIKAINELGMQGKVKVYMFDIDENVYPLIDDGSIIATIDQQPFPQGYLSVMNLYLKVKYGITPPPESLTGPALIDKANLVNWKSEADAVTKLYGQ